MELTRFSDLGNLPEPLEDHELTRRVQLFRETGECREDIIVSHLKMSLGLVSWFTRKCPRKEDEFLSTAFLELIEAVERFRIRGKDNNISGYLYVSIRFALLDELVEGRPVKLAENRSWEEQVEEIEETSVYLRDPDKIIQRGSVRLELRDIIECCAQSEEEWQIILLTYQGYTLVEIAEQIGRGKSYVGKVRTQLFDRFIHYWTKDDD